MGNKWTFGLHASRLSPKFIWMLSLLLTVRLDTLHCQQVDDDTADNVIRYEILEEQQPNTLIGNIITDADLDTKYSKDTLDQLSLGFLSHSSKYMEYFVIEEQTGLFRTQKTLDRDVICIEQTDKCLIHLDVAVEPVQYFEIIKVSVQVLDMNDNYPTFPEPSIILSISETTSLGASFAIPGADDADTGLFGVQSYQLLSSESSSFELRGGNEGSASAASDSDLQLVLMDKLDREVKDAYTLKIVAKDGGIPQKTGTVLVDITILDVNDNNPQFVNQSYSAIVFENIPTGSVIVSVKAHDEDNGLNGEIMYEFSRVTQNLYGYLFEINSFTGEIFSKDVIDYEENKEFTLGVVAKDKGPNALSDYAKVVIHVWDVNDHAPGITINAMSDTGVVQIKEGSDDGSFVAHISVNDLDSGENGQFTCSLEHDSFRLVQLFSTEFKVVSSKVFDRELRDQYTITIICQDAGTNPQTSSHDLLVEIQDVNDHAPVFTSDFYTLSLRENNSIGEVLTQVNATDRDIGLNADIVYSLEGDLTSMLNIDSKTGVISTKDKFDFEEQQEFQFTVIAMDKGTPSLSTTGSLTVSVLDINDNIPKFPQKSYTFGTFENQASGTEIGTMEAFDLDAAPYDIIVYTFDYTHGDVGVFKIDPYSGKITTRKVLDREEKDTYHLIVIARNDGFLLSSSVGVIVYVADQNDNPPVIIFPYENNNTVQVSSFAAVDDPVTFIEAFDDDIANNAQLSFSILGGSGQDMFEINAYTGQIFVKEDISIYADQTVQLTVLVQDKGESPLSSLADLYIHINASMSPVNSGYSGIGGELSETNLVIIVCLSIIAVVLLFFVLLIVLLLRRHRSRRGNKGAAALQLHRNNRGGHGHDPACVCKYCRVVKYVQYDQAQREPGGAGAGGYECQCTYVHGAKDHSADCQKYNQTMYLQMQPQHVEAQQPQQQQQQQQQQEKGSFLKFLCNKSKVRSPSGSGSSSSNINKKRKVHFVEDEQQAPNPAAYQDINSSNPPSVHNESSSDWPDLLERNQSLDLSAEDRGNPNKQKFQQRPTNHRQHPRGGEKQHMPLQVHSMLYPVIPADNGSDHGSSCDSGHGPSEEEQDHSRHSNILADPYHHHHHHHQQQQQQHLSPTSSNGSHQLSPDPRHHLQRPSGSCSLHNNKHPRSNRPSSKCALHNPSLSSSSSPASPASQQQQQTSTNSGVWSTPNSLFHTQPSGKQSIPPPRVPWNSVQTSKPLPDLPPTPIHDVAVTENDEDEDDDDDVSDGDSTTTSGSYMVDTMLDLSAAHGAQISPRDVYV